FTCMSLRFCSDIRGYILYVCVCVCVWGGWGGGCVWLNILSALFSQSGDGVTPTVTLPAQVLPQEECEPVCVSGLSVCVCERERERVCVCVCARAHMCA